MATKRKSGQKIIVTGKRKNAIARVVLQPATDGAVTVNGKKTLDYFGHCEAMSKKLVKPFQILGLENQYNVIANVRGGGIVGQADAVMYAIAKALSMMSDKNRQSLKSIGLLSRDSRIKERKKYGRKKARKKFQFSKR